MEGQETRDPLFEARNEIGYALSNTEALMMDYKDKPDVIETRLQMILDQISRAKNSLDQIQ